jgi:hypothetical protein
MPLEEKLHLEVATINNLIEDQKVLYEKYKQRRFKSFVDEFGRIKSVLLAMADAESKGKLSPYLNKVRSWFTVQTILRVRTYPKATYSYGERACLDAAELNSTELVLAAKKELKKLTKKR